MTDMPEATISAWEAKRSGATMTIHGINYVTDEAIRVSNVETIGCSKADPHPIAITTDGKKYELI